MFDINTLTVSGKVEADAKAERSNSGLDYCRFTIVATEKRQSGDLRTSHIRCTAFGDLAAQAGRLMAGDTILVVGKLMSRPSKDGRFHNLEVMATGLLVTAPPSIL